MKAIDHKAFFINGAWRAADGTDRFDVISPRSEQRIGSVPAASKADIDAAVAAARHAFDAGEWPRLTPAERADYLSPRGRDRAATERTRRADHRGARLHAVPLADLPDGVACHELQLRRRDRPVPADGRGARQRSVAARGRVGGRRHHPHGRVQPGRQGTRRGGRQLPGVQLRASCDRSEGRTGADRGLHRRRQGHRTQPLALFVVGEICEEIGLPPGVLNIVAARAPESGYLVRHPGVDMVSFTGSVEVGARIAAACGELIRPCVLELGGKSAAIVLEDAKLEDVVPVLVGASVGTNMRPELRRPDPAPRTRVAVPRLCRGPGRRIRLAQGRRPHGRRHGGRSAGHLASA